LVPVYLNFKVKKKNEYIILFFSKTISDAAFKLIISELYFNESERLRFLGGKRFEIADFKIVKVNVKVQKNY